MTKRIGAAHRPEARLQAAPERAFGIRAAALMGLFAPVATLVHILWSRGHSDLPAMVAVATVLLMVSGGLIMFAGPLSRSRLRRQLNIAAVLVHLGGAAALSFLDGGVASPLGTLIYLTLPFIAISVPTHLFVPFAAYAVALYSAVAVVGGPAPPGHAYVYTMAFLGVSAVGAIHTRSLSSLRHRLTEIARVDPLTSILNHRGFDEQMDAAVKRADRDQRALSVVLFDLDHFKSVNDTDGHQAGDALLIWTTDTLRRAARPRDVVARIGGDEFAVVLRDTDEAGAAAFVSRLRITLEETSPASIGTATYPTEATTGEGTLHLADKRVYEDKAARAQRPLATRRPPPCRTAKCRRGDVSSIDHRRGFIAGGGFGALANAVIAISYVLLLAGADTPKLLLLALYGTGASLAIGLVAGAGRMARAGRSLPLLMLMLAYTGLQLALATVATAWDGGLASPTAVILLAPLPHIALTNPLRLSIPIGTIVAGSYIGIGLVVGTPNWSYAVMNLVGVLAIAAACASAHHVATKQRQLLTSLSQIDSLTGCLNRRGFEERFTVEIGTARRQGHGLCLLIIDLDGFKQVNDTEGHAAGDELLRWVGTALAQALPEGAAVGRLGGDEFIALLTGRHADDAQLIAEQVQVTLAQRTGASLGLARMGSHGEDFDALYRQADTMLYTQKVEKPNPGPVPSGAGVLMDGWAAADLSGRNRSDGPPLPADGIPHLTN